MYKVCDMREMRVKKRNGETLKKHLIKNRVVNSRQRGEQMKEEDRWLDNKDREVRRSFGGCKQSLGQEAEAKEARVKVVVLLSMLSTTWGNQLCDCK